MIQAIRIRPNTTPKNPALEMREAGIPKTVEATTTAMIMPLRAESRRVVSEPGGQKIVSVPEARKQK